LKCELTILLVKRFGGKRSGQKRGLRNPLESGRVDEEWKEGKYGTPQQRKKLVSLRGKIDARFFRLERDNPRRRAENESRSITPFRSKDT